MASSTARNRSSRPLSNAKSRKVIERLQQKIEDGSFYEAHQTYRALYQRFCAQGSEEQAMSLLLEGASTLLKHKQWESGTDLGLLLVNHLKERHSPITEDTLDMISQLFVLYKAPSVPTEPSPVLQSEIDPREVFMRAALKWSSMVGGEDCKYGHPHLHKMLALSYWEAKQYARAREHFQYACQPEDYAAMLVEVAATHGHPKEADLFLTQAVLQLLVLRNRRSAMGVYSVYTQTHPVFRHMEGPPYEDEEAALLNFTWFLLLSTESGDGEVFNFLRRSYSKALSRDPCFDDYLDKIGVSFFGCAESASAPAGQGSAALGGPGGGSGALGGLLDLLGGGGAGGGGGGGGLLGNLMGSLSGLAGPAPQGSTPSGATPTTTPFQPHPLNFNGNLLQSADIVD